MGYWRSTALVNAKGAFIYHNSNTAGGVGAPDSGILQTQGAQGHAASITKPKSRVLQHPEAFLHKPGD